MIRPAQPLDAGRTGEILSRFTDDTPWLPRISSRAEDIRHVADLIDRGWVHVLCLPQVAGFVARDGETLHALYLREDMRGAGHGKALLDHAKRGVDRLELWTCRDNEAALRFYRREGFEPVATEAETRSDEGVPEIRLVWERKAA